MGIVWGRKRQEKEENVLFGVDGEAIPVSKSKSSWSELFPSGFWQCGGDLTERRGKNKRERRAIKLVWEEVDKLMQEEADRMLQKEPEPVRCLVDYELPSGVDRLGWDTDEVRRMVGEIE